MEEKVIFEFGPFYLDPSERQLLRQGQPINLSPQLFNLLLVFVENAGRLLPKEELRTKVWGNAYVSEDALKVIIGNLRKALGNGQEGGQYIQNVRGGGYRFTAEVRRAILNRIQAGPAPDLQVPEEFSGEKSSSVSGAATSDPPFPGSEEKELRAISKANDAVGSKKTFLKSPRHRTGILIVAGAAIAVVLAMALSSFTLQPRRPHVLKYNQLTYNDKVQDGLFTDGAHVYFQQLYDRKEQIAEVPAEGGETVFIPTPFESTGLIGVTNNGSSLIVVDRIIPGATYWKLPLPGGPPQALWSPPSWDLDVSGDGKRIAYIQNEGRELCVANIDGTGIHSIYSHPPEPYRMSRPRWSPDGKLIAFNLRNVTSATGKEPSSFWAVAPDGSQLQMIVPWSPMPKNMSSWTPDGRYFVFDAGNQGKSSIWAMPIKSSNWLLNIQRTPFTLTDDGIIFFSPVVSPDGKKIFVFGKQHLGQLVRYDPAKSNFVPFLGGISAGSLDFSRDGEWVTYVKHPEGTLWRSRMDGSEKFQLTFSPLLVDSPRWSPDGKSIVYRAAPEGEPKKLFLVSRNGGVASEILPGEKEEQGVATWSPDGKSLVFGMLRFSGDKCFIRVLDLASREITNVPDSAGLWTPRWSPSGRYLLALKADPDSPNSGALLIFDFRTRKWKTLATHKINEPVWSHDEKFIYFDILQWLEDDGVYRVRVQDGKIEKVVSLRDFPRAFGHSFGVWFGLAPDDSPLLLRDLRQNEIYALDMQW